MTDRETLLQGMNRTECEVWSRVTGYLRPVKTWNKGKQAEWDKRTAYKFQTVPARDGG